MPVVNSSVGAAVAAAAIDIHGVWLVSVNSIPEKPWASTSRASCALAAQVVAPTIRSNRIVSLSRVVAQAWLPAERRPKVVRLGSARH